MELLTPNGITDHGIPDPLPPLPLDPDEAVAIGLREIEISQEAVDQLDRMMAEPSPLSRIVPRQIPDADPLPLDPPGLCPRCKLECRDFQNVRGRELCDSCANIVRDLYALHRDLVGTGEP